MVFPARVMSNITQRHSLTSECAQPGYTSCHVAFWILKTVPIVLLCIGTCGNILSLVVLMRKRLRSYSTTMFLLFLAGSDLTLLWSSVLRRIFLFVARVDIRNTSELLCKTNEWVAMTSGSYSIWLLVLLTIERAVFTKSPVFAKRKLTRKVAFFVCLALLFLIASVNIHYVFGRKLRTIIDIEQGHGDGNRSTPLQRQQCTYTSESYGIFVHRMWPAIGLGIFNVLPVIIIFIGNFSIFLKLRQQKRKLCPASENFDYLGYDRNAKATKILFVLCGFFLLTTTPYSVYFTVYYAIRKNLTDSELAGATLGYSIIMVLLWSNFSFNFFLYFASGSLFKKEWRTMMADVKSKFYAVFRANANLQNDTSLTLQHSSPRLEDTKRATEPNILQFQISPHYESRYDATKSDNLSTKTTHISTINSTQDSI